MYHTEQFNGIVEVRDGGADQGLLDSAGLAGVATRGGVPGRRGDDLVTGDLGVAEKFDRRRASATLWQDWPRLDGAGLEDHT